MRYLSPSQYSVWPTYAQRICFAYNSVAHASLSQLSPFEMDFASPARSPFGPPDPALSLSDQLDFTPTSPVSPEAFAAALRLLSKPSTPWLWHISPFWPKRQRSA
jgi:hypothetical protein